MTKKINPTTGLCLSILLFSLTACSTQTARHTPIEPVLSTADVAIATEAAQTTPTVDVAIQASETTELPQVEDRNPTALWSRVFALYQLPETHNARIQKEIDWLLKHPSHLQQIQTRAEPYLYYIVEELEKRQLPGELALLPAVESGYRPFAYSHGRAAGLWQFIPSTGEHFGLKQTWWYDGRRDITESTHAALTYLDRLHQRCDQDWLLALASYNAGAGNIDKAIRLNRKRGKASDFWALDLRTETERYVPRLLAMAHLLANADQYGVELNSIPNEPYFAKIDVQHQIDLAKAAELAEMSMDEFYEINPAFNQWATDPKGPHHVLVYSDRVDEFQSRLNALPANQRVQWKRHKIKNGETLIHIAKKHHVTVAMIRQANQLSGSNIRAGKYLLIPTSSEALAHYSKSSHARLVAQQSKSRSGARTEYRVRSGDSLWTIARKHKVGVRQLASWNSMAPGDVLRPGAKLVIWSKHAPVQTAQRAKTFNHLQTVHYTIRKGDSLYKISQRFDVSVADLKRWNDLNSRFLQPGQKLKLIVDVTRS